MSKFLKIIIIIVSIIGVSIGVIYFSGTSFIKEKLDLIKFESINKENLGKNEEIKEDIEDINDISLDTEEFKEVKTIAIFGSDSRNVDDTYENSRSDGIMIVNINPLYKHLSFISIPRDTYVNVPGHGMTKINHAFAYGQEELALKTINENFGLDIDEYITVSWEAVTKLVDMVGGIRLQIY